MAITRSSTASSRVVATKKTERKSDKAPTQQVKRRKRSVKKKKKLPKWVDTILKRNLLRSCNKTWEKETLYAMRYPSAYAKEVLCIEAARAKRTEENHRKGHKDVNGNWHRFLPFGRFTPRPSWH